MKRYFFAFLVLTFLIGIVVAIERFRPATVPAGTSSPSAGDGFPRTLVGRDGSRLVIPKKPQRIVSQTLATDEILLKICSTSRLAALHTISLDPNYSNCVEESKTVPVHLQADVEKILKLQPDLIFVASYSKAETVQLLAASGAPVIKFETFDSIEGIEHNIAEVGDAIGEVAAASTLVKDMEAQLKRIQAKLPPTRPRVISFSQAGYIAGKGTIFDDCVRLAGAVNIASEKGMEGFPKIGSETVLEWDPDYLVIGANTGEFDTARRKLLSDPVIASSRAARLNHIVVVDTRYFLAVSQHAVTCVKVLAEELHK